MTALPGGTEFFRGDGDSTFPVHRFTHRAMGGPCEVIVHGQEPGYAAQAARAAFEELDRIELELSRFVEFSDISQINALRAGESVRVGVAAFDCLELAARVSAQTGGALDVTVGALLSCRTAPGGGRREPSETELAEAMSRTGMHLLDIDAAGHSVGVRADGVGIDLGAVGKGYAVDRMAAVLREYGMGTALIHAGTSSVFAIGSPPGQPGWRAVLRDPEDQAASLGVVHLLDRSLGASGTPPEGPHILDPRTGRFVQDKLGAWAAAPSAALADALSTAFFVLPPAEVEQYCGRHAEVSAIVKLRNPTAAPVLHFGEPLR